MLIFLGSHLNKIECHMRNPLKLNQIVSALAIWKHIDYRKLTVSLHTTHNLTHISLEAWPYSTPNLPLLEEACLTGKFLDITDIDVLAMRC